MKDKKCIRWMPWVLVPMKDVQVCVKPRRAGKKRYYPGFPNEETQSTEM